MKEKSYSSQVCTNGGTLSHHDFCLKYESIELVRFNQKWNPTGVNKNLKPAWHRASTMNLTDAFKI